MKCMSKKVIRNKNALLNQREREAEEIRWNNLTPEEQEKELAEKEVNHKRVMQTLSDIGTIMSCIDKPYRF